VPYESSKNIPFQSDVSFFNPPKNAKKQPKQLQNHQNGCKCCFGEMRVVVFFPTKFFSASRKNKFNNWEEQWKREPLLFRCCLAWYMAWNGIPTYRLTYLPTCGRLQTGTVRICVSWWNTTHLLYSSVHVPQDTWDEQSIFLPIDPLNIPTIHIQPWSLT